MTDPINRETILDQLCDAHSRQASAEQDAARLSVVYDLLTLCHLLEQCRDRLRPVELNRLLRLALNLRWEIDLSHPDNHAADWRDWVNQVLNQAFDQPALVPPHNREGVIWQ